MFAHAAEHNSRLDFMALKDLYEGVGVHAVNAVQNDKLLNFFLIQVKINHTCGEKNLRGSLPMHSTLTIV